MTITRSRLVALSIGAAVALGVSLSVPALEAAASTASVTATATTVVTNRDDSGINGPWALDNFTRTASITFQQQVDGSKCGGIAPCYAYTGPVSDKGHFTTQVGDQSPGAGDLNAGSPIVIGEQVTGKMHGGLNYFFYATTPPAGVSAAYVATTVNGDTPSTQQWVEQFFPAGTTICDTNRNCSTLTANGQASGGSESLGTTGGWTYIAGFGADSACPNVASRWMDASASDWGTEAISGNILAPDASHC
jgi:hypothetical protein